MSAPARRTPGRGARGRLARALRTHAQRQVETLRRETHYAVVRQLSPIQVEVQDRNLILDEDDLVITQWVRRYDYDHSLQVGDTVLVSRMPNDDFVLHDVVSSARIEAGLDLANVAASGDPTAGDHVVRKVPFLDPDGVVLGYIAVYGALP